MTSDPSTAPPRWASRWASRRAAGLDIGLAVVIAGAGLGGSLFDRQSSLAPTAVRALWLVTALAAGAAALVRRRRPPLFAVVAVLDGLTRRNPSAGLPFAAYAVGRHQPAGRVRWTMIGVVTLAGLRPWQFHSLASTAGNIASAGFVVLLPAAVGAWARTRAELLTALRERAERAEREQDLRANQAVLTERARIAQEMHDVVGHRVSLMVLQAGAIEMAAADPGKVGQLAGQVQDAGRRALTELRQLVGLLRTDSDADGAVPLRPQPTLADLDELLAGSRGAGVEVSVQRRGSPRRLDPTVERTAYRVVQEAMTNAGKHAPGAAVAVTLDFRPDALAVQVRNRRPTRPAVPIPGGGHGLVGLRERVRTLGGELRAEPRLDGGFQLEAVLPV